MHETTARVAMASVEAARQVWTGQALRASNISGGLHHAMPAKTSGFCVYNDIAIAIQWLLDQGCERVGYVDVDVHHGDGVQAVFFADPRVLTVSVHQDGATLFPGTGAIDELGSGDARGTKVNLPLPPFTGDDLWLGAFADVVPPLVEAWAPDVLVTQLGCDTHHHDPLAEMHLTTAAYRRTASILHDLAHRAAGGRWVATGGGGYQWARVVPRAWTIYFAEMAGVTVPDDIPPSWLDEARSLAGYELPPRLSEPPARPSPIEPAEISRIVEGVKAAVWPHHS
jgi:acetoin utilization protein AcuC